MDFQKIPKELHARIIQLVNENKLPELLLIHDQYKLTQYDYGCCTLEGLLNWFKHGIEIGAITDKE